MHATFRVALGNMVSASLSLGATPLETFFHVTLPVIAPGVTSGALLDLDLGRHLFAGA